MLLWNRRHTHCERADLDLNRSLPEKYLKMTFNLNDFCCRCDSDDTELKQSLYRYTTEDFQKSSTIVTIFIENHISKLIAKGTIFTLLETFLIYIFSKMISVFLKHSSNSFYDYRKISRRRNHMIYAIFIE
jgi:hypothetical protein